MQPAVAGGNRGGLPIRAAGGHGYEGADVGVGLAVVGHGDDLVDVARFRVGQYDLVAPDGHQVVRTVAGIGYGHQGLALLERL